MKKKFGVIRCSFQYLETVPKHLHYISGHSEENPSKTSTAVKKANPIPEPKINCSFG
jgi:hypothetical protein